jgi:hypothetical protein
MFQELSKFDDISEFSEEIEVRKPNFVEFGSFDQIEGKQIRSTGSIFKSDTFTHNDTKKIEVSREDDDQPIIVIRRRGDEIESIEFACKCGRSSIVKIEQL